MKLCTASFALLAMLALGLLGCAGQGNGSRDADPAIPTAEGRTPDPAVPAIDPYQVKLTTSKGDVVIQVHPEWAPHGAARFKELVELGFYDDCRFFRVLDGFMAQVGMNGNPAVNAQWQENTIPDDPVNETNIRGRVTFATSGPDSRTTQIFINYADNGPSLDGQGFSPFGEVIEGMDVIDSLYSEYGEGAPQGFGPSQGMIAQAGNEYLNAEFPMLDYIQTATIVGAEPAGDEAATATEEPAADAATDPVDGTEN